MSNSALITTEFDTPGLGSLLGVECLEASEEEMGEEERMGDGESSSQRRGRKQKVKKNSTWNGDTLTCLEALCATSPTLYSPKFKESSEKRGSENW